VLNNVNESTKGISLTERNNIENAANPRTLLKMIMTGYFVLNAFFRPRLRTQGKEKIIVNKKLKKIT